MIIAFYRPVVRNFLKNSRSIMTFRNYPKIEEIPFFFECEKLRFSHSKKNGFNNFGIGSSLF
jgi:hypothetical protein